MGTKERNTMVKSSSEYALISVLKLRKDDTLLNVRIHPHLSSKTRDG
jgi:hypothetical protein